jgi:hypothetical protein
VGLAAAIGGVPRVVVLGIEAENDAPGAALSASVERGLSALGDRILDEVRSLLEGDPGAEPLEAERSPGRGPTGPNRERGSEPR